MAEWVKGNIIYQKYGKGEYVTMQNGRKETLFTKRIYYMSGTKMGRIKAKLGLKGRTKTGEMLSRMNKIKTESITKATIKKII